MRYNLLMRHFCRHTLLWPLLLLGPAGHVWAQAPAAPRSAKTGPPPLTLARALATLPPPTKGVWLTVGADKVTLPDGTLPPPADASVTVLANAFGDETQDFGSVTAIAPFTHVLLNTDPGPPDLSVDMSGQSAFQRLAASLDDSQWKALTSSAGLGLSDLTDDTQKMLFHGLFSHGQLWVASQDPALNKLPADQRTDTRNVSGQIDGVRLRLGQTTRIYIHDRQGKTIYFSGPPADVTSLHTWHSKAEAPAAQHNVVLRAIVPNTPKSSNLALNDAKFQSTVSLTGARTVAELIARIAAKTHTEMYADPHYAARTLTVIGPTQEAPAEDVLRALALAVAGAYRQIGPAYVLTDDLEGVGTRRHRLANWEDGASKTSSALDDQAGAVLLQRRGTQARSLPTFGDPQALTPAQMAAMRNSLLIPAAPEVDRKYPFAKLTPAQQNRVHQIADAYEEQQATKDSRRSDEDTPQEPDPTGAVDLAPEYSVQFLVPTVDGPVQTNIHSWLIFLFWDGLAAIEARQAKTNATAAMTPAEKLPPAPPLLPLLRSRPRRAVFGHPTTPAAVDALVAAMQKIGLNELWLDVFSEGKSHLADHGTDILTEALTKTQGTGIAVYADLSLLPWGNQPPKEVRDLTILGQDSRQAAIADHDRSRDGDYDAAGQPIPYVPPPVQVSPVSPQVQKALTDTVRSLASRPGLAGFVWQDAKRGDNLGYTPAMRLAFLRAFHTDPVDITLTDYPHGDVSLPTFDDKAVEDALTDHWDNARQGANSFFLTQLRQAVPVSANKPVLMRCNDNVIDWLASWDDPRLPAPPLRTLFAGNDYPSAAEIQAGVAKQGKATFVVIPVRDPANIDALARDLQDALPPSASLRTKPAWDGYVLDFRENRFTDGDHPMSDLVQAAGQKR